MSLMISLILLPACNLEQVGAYTCDEYCPQVLDKTEECAQQQFTEDCQAAGGTNCDQMTDEALSAYAGEGRDDWADASRADMLASCQQDIEDAGKSDSACQAETATINNLTCDQILDLLGDIQSAA